MKSKTISSREDVLLLADPLATETRRHRELHDLNALTDKIIGCAIEVHKALGPGLLESIYEKALCYELELKGIKYVQQAPVSIQYKGQSLGDLRIDLIIEKSVVIELKAVDRMDSVFQAQLLSYLKLTGKRLGLLINFNVPVLKAGIQRIAL